ncbi:hypothetical protein COY52_09200 [Candidatus Desantisbacteria bacterium CG_4_10_14_0_8_um_filter_48_22]|uniref:Type IX secretion system protein PorV domain-containing protein n=1 Tax=Candidatus Desantisbacteria bacterium CG_4_10_14_0_8_um_filter_48_22 TaxID=1974543 RepID=A0A2M7S890_9BACT|nr:MAG: hypothetical protein COY52_09200 [Candidatus Desantisbacteria bacterium CG_4_10_14_0_8_um_filter_48_22]
MGDSFGAKCKIKNEGKMKKIIFLVVTLHLTLYTLHGICAGPGTTGAIFLKLGVGSRPVAMGEAFVAAADDINALYWNPSGLSLAEGKQVIFTHTEWFQAIRYEYLAYCQSLRDPFGTSFGVIGAGITYLYITDIERRDLAGTLLGTTVPANDLAIAVSYAKTLSERLNLGGTVKIINQQLDDKSALGAAIDLGMQYNLNKEGLVMGLALQNMGYEAPFITEASPLPMNLKVGIANKSPDSKLTLSADLNYSILDSIWAVGAGIEYWVHSVLAIRAGYKYNSAINNTLGALAGLTCGAGFNIGILGIDYALVPYGDLGYTHRVSLLAKF